MTRPKIGFLPAFFTALAIVFCIALWLRIRSYSAQEEPARRTTFQRTADATSAPAVVPASPSHDIIPDEAATTASQQQQSAKRREFTIPVELTNAPPPRPAGQASPTTQPPPRPSTEKPSLFARIVNPIVNALSGGAHASPNAPSPTPQTSVPQHQPSTSTGTHGGTTDTTGTTDKRDPTSDTQPPQLVAISFNPPQVRDGEETLLTVQAMDDLSGIRSISGTIIAPSNAVQGFALQREFESDRYVARITVPKDAAEGVWRVNYLSLIDNASNSTTLSGAQGAMPPSAAFRVVSSRSDSTGPTLKAVWVDKPAIRAGEKDTVFVDATDDQSGVQLISGVFISPSRQARIGFACRPGSSGPWECEVSAPACLDCGDWHLEQLQLQDKANNMTTVRADNPLVGGLRLNIGGEHCDATAPALQAITLDRNAVSNVDDSVINITAMANDDSCGVMSMSAQATGPTGSARLYVPFSSGGGQTWIGRLVVPKLAAKGTWRITWFQVLDQGHNLKTYSQSDAVLANAVFNVQ